MSVIEAIFILIILLGILAGVGAVIYLGFFYKPPAPVLCTNSTCDFTNKCMIQICSDGTRCVSNPFCGSSPLSACVNFTDLTCNFTDGCMFQVCENGVVRCNPDSRCSSNPQPNPVTQCSTTDDTIWVNDTCDMTNGCMNQHCSLDPSQKRCKTSNACTNPNPNPNPQWSTYKCMSDASFTKDEIGMCAKASQKCLNTSDCVLQSSPSSNQRCSSPTYKFDGCDFNQCNMYRYTNDCGNIVVNSTKPPSGGSCDCSDKWPLDNPNYLLNIGLPTGDAKKPYYHLAMQNNKLSLSNTVNPVFVDHQANGKIYVTYNMNDAFFVKKDLSLSTNESDGAVWYYNTSTGLMVDDPIYPTVLWSIDSSNNVILIPYHQGVENINLDHKNVWRYSTSF